MLLSEGLSKLNKKGSLGLRHQELGFHAGSKHTVWGVVLKKLQGSVYENWDTLPRHMLSQKRALAPTKRAHSFGWRRELLNLILERDQGPGLW